MSFPADYLRLEAVARVLHLAEPSLSGESYARLADPGGARRWRPAPTTTAPAGHAPESPTTLSTSPSTGPLPSAGRTTPIHPTRQFPELPGLQHHLQHRHRSGDVRDLLDARRHHGGSGVPGGRPDQRRSALLLGHRGQRGGFESDRSPLRGDTPRPDSRKSWLCAASRRIRQQRVPVLGRQRRRQVEGGELGRVRTAAPADIDFAVDRDASGDLFLTPVRAGTGVEY